MMKNCTSFLFIIIFLIVSCSRNDKPVDSYLEISTTQLFFWHEGGSKYITVRTNGNFSALPGSSWCEAEVLTASKDNLKVTVSGNDIAGKERTAEITILSEYLEEKLMVSQLAEKPSIHVNEKTVAIYESEGLDFKLTVTANIPIVFELPAWIRESTDNSTNEKIYSFTASAMNDGEISRSGEIIVKPANIYPVENVSITVTQAFTNPLYLGATTPMGRQFVSNSTGLVSNVLFDKQYALNEQVSVLEIAYTYNATGPYSVFIFDVKLKNGTTIRMTTADDEDSSIKPTTSEQTRIQNIRGQLAAMQNKRNSTLDVLGGVNADFYGLSAGHYMLSGIMYRGGVCLKSVFSENYSNVFAIMTDRTARIMYQTQYALTNKNDILEAVCGSYIILQGGTITMSNTELEPRTGVGISKERDRVFLLVVDGRREGYSMGASWHMMANMLRAMGAYDAINLDGGGSSTFVVKSSSAMPSTATSFETRNRTTDPGGDRSVPNGIAIVKLK
jgi:hypothetical protein